MTVILSGFSLKTLIPKGYLAALIQNSCAESKSFKSLSTSFAPQSKSFGHISTSVQTSTIFAQTAVLIYPSQQSKNRLASSPACFISYYNNVGII